MPALTLVEVVATSASTSVVVIAVQAMGAVVTRVVVVVIGRTNRKSEAHARRSTDEVGEMVVGEDGRFECRASHA